MFKSIVITLAAIPFAEAQIISNPTGTTPEQEEKIQASFALQTCLETAVSDFMVLDMDDDRKAIRASQKCSDAIKNKARADCIGEAEVMLCWESQEQINRASAELSALDQIAQIRSVNPDK